MSRLATDDSHVKWNIGVQPISLDPQLSDDYYGQAIIHQLYVGLFEYRDDQLQLALCQNYHVSDDETVYTFYLKDSVWSNGQPVTAWDFEYAIRRILQNPNPSPNKALLNKVKGYQKDENLWNAQDFGVRALDSRTLQISLQIADEYLLEKLALPPFMPVYRPSITGDKTWYHQLDTFVSNGPFMLSEFNVNRSYLLTKNDNYYRSDDVAIADIIVEMITDDASKYIAFQNERLNLVDEILPQTIVNLKTAREAVVDFDFPVTVYLQLNSNSEPLDNTDFRRALSAAIDRQALVDDMQQQGDAPASGIIPRQIMLADGQPFREQAGDYGVLLSSVDMGLIEQIRTDNPALFANDHPLRLIAPVGQQYSESLRYIAYMWQQVLGIDVEISLLNWQDYNRALSAEDYDVALIKMRFNLADSATILASYCTGVRQIDWENGVYDNLIKLAVYNNPNYTDRRLVLAERLLIDEARIIALYYGRDYSLISSKLQNCVKSPSGHWQFKDAYFIKWGNYAGKTDS